MYGRTEPRLSVLTIPRRQHAGKTSVESLDLQYQKDQAKWEAKMKARADTLQAYEKGLGSSSYSPITGSPIGTPSRAAGTPSRIPRFSIHVDAAGLPSTPTVPEHCELRAPESDFGSTVVEYERPETPAAMRHRRRESGSINLFAPPPAIRTDANIKVKPPFATDDETPRAYRPQKAVAPFATDDEPTQYERERDTPRASRLKAPSPYATVDDQPSTKPASSRPCVTFPWQWAFQDDDGNPLPEAAPAAESSTTSLDFSNMEGRDSPPSPHAPPCLADSFADDA